MDPLYTVQNALDTQNNVRSFTVLRLNVHKDENGTIYIEVFDGYNFCG